MKRVISLLTAIFIFSAAFTVFSAEMPSESRYCIIQGILNEKMAGRYISILLDGKSDGKIGHIGMTQINNDGSYFYKFLFDGNISDYKINTAVEGERVKSDNADVITYSNPVEIEAVLKNETGESFRFGTDRKLYLNLCGNENFSARKNVTAASAVYNSDGRMLLLKILPAEQNLKEPFSFETVIDNIPEDAANAKVFLLENLETMRPVAESVTVGKEYGKCFYAAPWGNDNNDGSFDAPLKTLAGAKSAVRRYKSANGLPHGGIKVIFREGDYFIGSTVKFTSYDAGTEDAPITYCAYDGENVSFSGGQKTDAGNLKLTDKNDALYERFAENVRHKIYSVDLKALGITDYGKVMPRNMSYYSSNTMGTEVFIDDRALTMAQWPNRDSDNSLNYVYSKGVVTNSTSADIEPVIEVYGETIDRIASWQDIENVLCEGIFERRYSFDAIPLAGFDADNGTITLKNGSIEGFSKEKDGNRFFFYNIPEELDADGEYYIDRSNGVLYICSDEAIPKGTKIGLSKTDGYLITLYNGADYINFKGINFELGRGNMMHIWHSKNINISDCRFRNCCGESLSIGGLYPLYGVEYRYGLLGDTKFKVDTKNITVRNCDFRNAGAGGINIFGGSFETLETANYLVENCRFDFCDRVKKAYAPAIRMGGVGMTVRGCTIANQYHQAMEASGTDVLIEFNEIYNCLRETSDAGVIYGQNPSIGTEIRYNYVHDIPDSGAKYDATDWSSNIGDYWIPIRAAFYIDGARPGMYVHHNVIKDVPIAMMCAGYLTEFNNNIMVDTYIPIYNMGAVSNQDFIRTVAENPEGKYDRYKVKYPQIFSLWDKIQQQIREGTFKTQDTYLNADNNVLTYDRLKQFYNDTVPDGADAVKTLVKSYDYIYDADNNFNNFLVVPEYEKVYFKNYNGGDFVPMRFSPILRKIPSLSGIDMIN